MDDRLQRRFRDADPLAAGDVAMPDPERLDAIKEQIMQTEARPVRAALRPRAVGLVGLAAAGLAVVLVAGSLLRPSASALAWDPSPTAVTDAQRVAATKACTDGLPAAAVESGKNAPAPVVEASGLPVIDVGGSGVGGPSGVSGTQAGGGPVTVTSGDGPVVPAPAIPDTLPALVGLELHGAGGVAIFADAKVTAYCLLAKDGDSLAMAGLLFPDLGNGASAGVGSIGTAGQGASSGSVSVSVDGFLVTAMSTTYKDETVGIIAGTAPKSGTRVHVVGGPADGATATVTDGRFAMWAPGDAGNQHVTVQVLDASGNVVASQDIGAPVGATVVQASAGH